MIAVIKTPNFNDASDNNTIKASTKRYILGNPSRYKTKKKEPYTKVLPASFCNKIKKAGNNYNYEDSNLIF